MFLRLLFRHRAAPLLTKLVSRASYTVKTPQTEQLKVSFTQKKLPHGRGSSMEGIWMCIVLLNICQIAHMCEVCDDS